MECPLGCLARVILAGCMTGGSGDHEKSDVRAGVTVLAGQAWGPEFRAPETL